MTCYLPSITFMENAVGCYEGKWYEAVKPMVWIVGCHEGVMEQTIL